ncbi:FHA domain-containing protein [Aphelenchoides besseyi]|nr:FHA domain-containing protein [Aphelenchoides besseyi]
MRSRSRSSSPARRRRSVEKSSDRKRSRSKDRNRRSKDRDREVRRRSRSRSPNYSSRKKRSPNSSPSRTSRWDRDNESKEDRREEPRKRRESPERERGGREWDRPKAKNFDPFSGEEKPETSKTEKDEKVSMPSFEPSGKLAADTNTFKGVVIKYNEPPEAAKPKLRWRLYPMKGEEVMQPIYIHRQSAYLIGRDRKIADFPVDHPSCSKQHAVLQYRSMPFEKNGHTGRRTLPYIIDLGSANGTYLNGDRIEAQRYYELKEQDLLKFGFSTREYAVLHELSSEGKGGEALDEDMEDDDQIDASGAEEKLMKQEEDYF